MYIEICNFGRIKRISCHFKKVNLLFGNGATISKIVAILTELARYCSTASPNPEQEQINGVFSNLLKKYRIAGCLKKNTFLRWEWGQHFLCYSDEKFSFSFAKTQNTINAIHLKPNDKYESVKLSPERATLFVAEISERNLTYSQQATILPKMVANLTNECDSNILLITTRNLFVFKALNNLVQAAAALAKNPASEEDIKKIIPMEQWLRQQDIVCVHVSQRGYLHDLADGKLYSYPIVSAVDDFINHKFGLLTDIKYKN